VAEPPVLTTANEDEIDLPRGLLEAVDLFESDDELATMLGKSFASTYAAIKRAEFETFMEVISPWEREYLLLNV
jgi:glutamine synthetase